MRETTIQVNTVRVELNKPGIYAVLAALEDAGIEVDYSSSHDSTAQRVHSNIIQCFSLKVNL